MKVTFNRLNVVMVPSEKLRAGQLFRTPDSNVIYMAAFDQSGDGLMRCVTLQHGAIYPIAKGTLVVLVNGEFIGKDAEKME